MRLLSSRRLSMSACFCASVIDAIRFAGFLRGVCVVGAKVVGGAGKAGMSSLEERDVSCFRVRAGAIECRSVWIQMLQ